MAGGHDPFLITEVYAYRGEVDAAFEWLEADARASTRRPIGNPALGQAQIAFPRATAFGSSLERLGCAAPLTRKINDVGDAFARQVG